MSYSATEGEEKQEGWSYLSGIADTEAVEETGGEEKRQAQSVCHFIKMHHSLSLTSLLFHFSKNSSI